jgi:hypothetical protein
MMSRSSYAASLTEGRVLRSSTKPTRRGQLFKEDFMQFSRDGYAAGREIVLCGAGFPVITMTFTWWGSYRIGNARDWVSLRTFGVKPYSDGTWSANFWIKLGGPFSELRWQEVGF